MSLFKPSTWGITKVYRDIENYRDWIRIIKREEADYQSKYSKWKLKHNFFYTIYFTMDIEENEAQLPEQIKRLRLIESLAPLHRYLDDDLGFAGCLTPEFNQFFDNDGKPTLTYLIAYRFSFNKLSLNWVIRWLFISIALLIGLMNLAPLLAWMQTLI
jgi:hypothetical protein